MSARFIRSSLLATLLAAALATAWAPAVEAQAPVAPGGPVLVIDQGDGFADFYGEILRAEGLNEFDVGPLTAANLASHQVAILSQANLSQAQAAQLDTWVRGGGNLIAMRPSPTLAGLLGLGAIQGTLPNQYLRVAPGRGITGETMQFHGTADRWSTAGATTIATLYSDADTPTASPAVTLRSVGAGQAAAFTYDLARSVVYTRQGNPAWAGDERDFVLDELTRSDDLFFGAKPGDLQPDWVNLDKVAIPQADEQQRLLADLITEMNADRMPLPRFWYLPRGEKAAVVMTGDDHAQGHNGTAGQFAGFKADSPAGCSVANWACVRSTSYVFPGAAVPGAEGFEQDGFEIGLHLNAGCPNNFTPASLRGSWDEQLPEWRGAFPTLNAPVTNRTHCISWSDWASEPIVERENGVRFDTNYYYWPAEWVQNRPGLFTGSGLPMRFANTDGSLIDVYQATTQMTDESGINYGLHISALLDGALQQGAYAVVTANMHTDMPQHDGADAIVAAAQARGVPVVSARQMLTWLDGRNVSAFDGLAFSSNVLQFTVQPGSGANGLQAMLPVDGPTGALTGVKRGAATVATSARTVGGTDYVAFDAAAGAYTATYGDPPVAPAPETSITDLVVSGGAATASFASDVAGASFQCSLDGAAFSACGSPAELTGLAVGSHTFQVRALGPGGTDATPAARTFAILPATPTGSVTPPAGPGETGSKPPGGGVLGGNTASDRSAPRMRVRTRRARANAAGVVTLRAACPSGEVRCRVTLRLRFDRHSIGSRTLALAGGETKRFRIQLRRGARRELAAEGSLRVTAAAKARDDAGNEATVRTAVRLLAPKAHR